MKRKIFGILLVLFGMAVIGCGDSTSSEDSDDLCTKDPAFCEEPAGPSDADNPADN